MHMMMEDATPPELACFYTWHEKMTRLGQAYNWVMSHGVGEDGKEGILCSLLLPTSSDFQIIPLGFIDDLYGMDEQVLGELIVTSVHGHIAKECQKHGIAVEMWNGNEVRV